MKSAREATMQAVRCPRCGLLVDPGDYGKLLITNTGTHIPEGVDGIAFFAYEDETPCPGSNLLGGVEELD